MTKVPSVKLGLTTLSGAEPVGLVLVACAGERIVAVDFTRQRLERLSSRRFGRVEWVASELYRREFKAYLSGDLNALDGLPIWWQGTPFQESVWRALCQIPRGETRTYGEIARSIGKPQAVRAVGLANALNPISLIVPCHRVIGSSGKLTGYAGGLDLKRWLLARESL
jgi:methylated-DNA-[protein]-cysteine S-methyltransferase